MKRSYGSDCCSKVPKHINCKLSCDFEENKDDILTDYARLLDSGELTDVDTLLARWWRRRSREPPSGVSATISVSPSTRLRQICRFVSSLYYFFHINQHHFIFILRYVGCLYRYNACQ